MAYPNRLHPDERALIFAAYVLETGCTVRTAASHFGFSKSTVHKDLTLRLRAQNLALAQEVEKVLERNKNERHIRGGNATKIKWKFG